MRASYIAADMREHAAPRERASRVGAKELLWVLHPVCERCGICPVVTKRGAGLREQVDMVCCPGKGSCLPAIREFLQETTQQLSWKVDPEKPPVMGPVDAYLCWDSYQRLKGGSGSQAGMIWKELLPARAAAVAGRTLSPLTPLHQAVAEGL